jgi:hypothetical protein
LPCTTRRAALLQFRWSWHSTETCLPIHINEYHSETRHRLLLFNEPTDLFLVCTQNNLTLVSNRQIRAAFNMPKASYMRYTGNC